MSSTSTPVRSNGSSTTSSPAHQKSRSPIILTPRSKIQALLASLDDDEDSDKENAAQRPGKAGAGEQVRNRHVEIGGTLGQAGKVDTVREDDSEEDEVVARRPRGRIVAALRLENGQLPADEKGSDSRENAYKEVRDVGRQSLVPTGKAIHRGTAQASAFSSAEESLAESESSDFQRRPRGIQRKSGVRQSTPKVNNGERNISPERPASPGLFLTPDQHSGTRNVLSLDNNDNTDSDLPGLPTQPGERLKQLVARKRQERLSKEKDRRDHGEDTDSSQAAPEKQRPKKSRKVAVAAESESDNDKEAGRKFTQQARPTRKASKKALEDMHRETQRISRNMQLAHEARTKIKFTTEDLMKKFNFRQSAKASETELVKGHASSSSIQEPGSDVEVDQAKGTPPSSPPDVVATMYKVAPPGKAIVADSVESLEHLPIDDDEDDDLPDLNTMLSQINEEQRRRPSSLPQNKTSPREEITNEGKKYSVKRFGKTVRRPATPKDSDDDLEIVKTAKSSRLAVFDQIPASRARESSSLHALRTLAHLHENDNPRNKSRKSITMSELQVLLQRRAKEQAAREREEKIQKLKEKGVIVMSAEEKEKDQLQLENMLEKARREADELRAKEKAAAKKEGRENGEEDRLADSDDEDENWDGSEDEGGVELSGSEDEESKVVDEDVLSGDDEKEEEEGTDTEADVDGEKLEEPNNEFLDNEAGEDDDEEEQPINDTDDEPTMIVPHPQQRMRNRKKTVVSDDEDDTDTAPADTISTDTSFADKSIETAAQVIQSQPSISDAFGFGQTKLALPGLSQVFGGTMADSPPDAFGFARGQPDLPGLSGVFANTMAGTQSRPLDEIGAIDSQQDSMELFRSLPPPSLPDFGANFQDDSQSFLVQDSQPVESGTGLVRFDTQTQAGYDESQVSEMPDPTPDVGFQSLTIQTALPPASYQTVATLPLPTPVIPESPTAVPRKGRLRRRDRLIHDSGDEDDGEVEDVQNHSIIEEAPPNAFDVLRGAGRRPEPNVFDKKRSEAKTMVEDQAEESEDEYAGLGGASDDESQGEVDEEVKKMIDDDGNEKVNEAEIAAFYADKERINDEKQVEKLYRDIANGGLRRKRGADMDFFHSDDEDEAAARRRATKQREFARMRKALLADEKLGKIAENPKQQAFLQAIEDRDEDEDLDIFEESEETISQVTDSQTQAQNQPEQSQQPAATANGKRNFSDFARDATTKPMAPRLPPNLRRTKQATKPTSFADIRKTLSEIIGEPDSIAETQESSSPEHSGDEAEEEDVEVERFMQSRSLIDGEMGPPAAINNPRRTEISQTRATVIDRMALKRAGSSSLSATHCHANRLAFQAPTLAASTSFRKPSLLRRATTASSITTTTSADSMHDRAQAGVGKETVKMGGSKKSSVNYYVREEERRARLEVVETEKRKEIDRVGRMRRSGVGLRGLVGGEFN